MKGLAHTSHALWRVLAVLALVCATGFTALAAANSAPLDSPTVRTLTATQAAFDVQGEIQTLLEAGPSAGIVAIAGGAQGTFTSQAANAIFALTERHTLWIRLKFERTVNAPQNWTLHIPLPYLDHAVLYQANAQGQWESQISGDMTPVSQWAHPGLYPEFQLNFPTSGPQDVYLEIRNLRPLSLPMRLASSGARETQREIEHGAIGLLLGTLLMLLGSCAIQYLVTRDDADGWYTLYIVLIMVVIAGNTGLSGQFLWPDSPAWSNYSFVVLPVLGVGATVLFVRHACALDISFPRLARGLDGFSWASVALALISIFIERTRASELQGAYLALGPVLIFVGAISAWRRGNPIGKWLFLAYAPLGLAVIFLAAQMFSLVATIWQAHYVMALAVPISIPLVIHALHLRSRTRHHAENRVSVLTTQDALTGLLLKPMFITQVENALTRAKQHKEPSAVVLVEIVNHPQLRAVYGEAVAEQCLLRAVVKLHRVLRDVDPAGRVDTARFGLVLEGINSRQTLNERMVNLIASGLIPLPVLKPEVTLHFHIACVLLSETIPDPRTILDQLEDVLVNMAPKTRRPIRFLEPLQTVPAPEGEESEFGENDTGAFVATRFQPKTTQA